jgi:hypothetical protein
MGLNVECWMGLGFEKKGPCIFVESDGKIPL